MVLTEEDKVREYLWDYCRRSEMAKITAWRLLAAGCAICGLGENKGLEAA